jgi:multimeric flavodoxin WrbA
MVKILGIGGSPRRKGNTDLLLDQALAGAAAAGAETEKVLLNRLKIRPCQECGSCNETGICRFEDDMQGLYDKLAALDGLILASPIFFMGLSAQTKTMVDRCQALWARKYLLGRPVAERGQRRLGLFIAVGATDRPFTFRPSITMVKAFFATLEVAYHAELLYPATDHKGQILDHPTAMQDAFQAGERLVRDLLGKGTKSAGEEGALELRRPGAPRPT